MFSPSAGSLLNSSIFSRIFAISSLVALSTARYSTSRSIEERKSIISFFDGFISRKLNITGSMLEKLSGSLINVPFPLCMSITPKAESIFMASLTEPRLTDSISEISVSFGIRSPGLSSFFSSWFLNVFMTKSTADSVFFPFMFFKGITCLLYSMPNALFNAEYISPYAIFA